MFYSVATIWWKKWNIKLSIWKYFSKICFQNFIHFQGFRQSYQRPGPFRAILSICFRGPWINRFRFMRGLLFVAYTGSGNWAVMVHERFPSLLEVNRTHFWSCLLSKILFYLLKVRYCQNVFMKSSTFQNTTEKIW